MWHFLACKIRAQIRQQVALQPVTALLSCLQVTVSFPLQHIPNTWRPVVTHPGREGSVCACVCVRRGGGGCFTGVFYHLKTKKQKPLHSICCCQQTGSDIIIIYRFLLEEDEGAGCDLSEEDQQEAGEVLRGDDKSRTVIIRNEWVCVCACVVTELQCYLTKKRSNFHLIAHQQSIAAFPLPVELCKIQISR